MTRRPVLLAALALMVVGLLSGCSVRQDLDDMEAKKNKQHKEAKKKVKKAEKQVEHSPLAIHNERLLTTSSSRIERSKNLPPRFEQQVSVNISKPKGFSDVFQRLSTIAQMPVNINQSLISGNQVSEDDPLFQQTTLHYDGTLKKLFDHVSTQFNLNWRYEQESVVFYRTITRTFRLTSLAGNSNMQASVTREQSASSGGSTGGGEDGGDNAETNTKTQSKQGVSMSAQSVSVWDATKKTIETMLTEEGEVTVTQANGLVTVKDQPYAVRRIGKYVRKQNESLSRQVLIDAQLYSVRLNKEAEAGINWDVIFQQSDLMVETASQQFNPATGSGLISVSLPSSNSSDFSTSSAMANALRQHGDVSLVTRSSLVTLNNQPAPLQIGNQTSFLSSVSTTQTPNVGSTTELTRGVVNTGLSMTIWPYILSDNRVLLQFSVGLSNLEQINSVSSGGQTIQTPEIRSRDFMQQAKVDNNETLLLTGFEQNQINTEDNTSLLGAGEKGDSNREVLVLMVTPHITPHSSGGGSQ